jgi:hypothetical protein
MFPWAAFPAAFLGFAPDDCGVPAGVGFLAGGASSSEKDSHPGSWIVTGIC